jgi:CRISPR-associated exonuclease Cas4
MLWLIGIACILLLLGWLLLGRSNVMERESGLPRGRLVYADDPTGTWHINDKPLFSATHNLVGKPDYLVKTKEGLIPVEVKSAPTPKLPYLGHLLQLAAYCLLIEETTGQAPPHGLLKYADALYEVDFTSELRRELLATLAEMRQARLGETVSRSHNQATRCAACGMRHVCDEALT